MNRNVMKLSRCLYPAIVDSLRQYGPNAYKVLQTIRLAVVGIRGVDVYTDGWPEYTTVLAQLMTPTFVEDSYGIFTTNEARCRQLLLNCDSFKWDEKHSFGGIGPPAISAIVDVGGIKGTKYRVNGPFLMMQITDKHMLTNFSSSSPPGYEFGTLVPSDAGTITSAWEYSEAGTEDFVRFIIENFATVSVRVASDDRLVGWYLQQPYGALGMLHVQDEHRGQGLGTQLVRRLTEKVLGMGQIPYVYVDEENTVSVRGHHVCGYTIADDIRGHKGHVWIKTVKS